MDLDKLIDDITVKVLEKIAEHEPEKDSKDKSMPKLLLLSQDNNDHCRRLLENGRLRELYAVECANLCEREIFLSDYEAVVLFDLTCDAMVNIALGLAGTEYTRLACEALLSGKRIYVPKGEIRLFRYKGTSPDAYYSILLEKLNFLASCGVVFCDSDKLEAAILCGTECCGDREKGRQVTLDKKVITEKDVRAISKDAVDFIVVNTGTIITDLALDYTRKCGLRIKKR